MEKDIVVAAVEGCMDARLQDPAAGMWEQLCKALGADKLYIPNTAGPDGKILAGGAGKQDIVDNMNTAIEKGGASVIGVLGHFDCAGHKVSDEQHILDTVQAVKELEKTIANTNVRFVPLVAMPRDEGSDYPFTWVIKEVVH